MRKVMPSALCLVLCAAVAFGAEPAEIGPRKNAEDQFRFFWLFPEDIYEDLVHSGFNLFIRNYWGSLRYDDGVTYGAPATAAKQRVMDRVLADGLDYIEQLPVGNDRKLRTGFPRKLRDGSDWDRNVDAGDPDAHELMLKAAEAVAHSVSNHPACIGVQPSSEIRDRTRPSFRPYLAETYRRDTGADLPPEVAERLAPHYTQIGDFPESRIVPLDYRLMKFYTWFWKKGDGWNGFQDDVVRLFRKETGRPLVSFYDPVVRTPPLWGSGGAELTWGNQWTYSYPEPYNIAFVIAEQQAMSRGVAGMGVISMAQGIVKRIHLAPKTEKPENEPGWLKAQADCDYFTTPPDMMREAIWSMFAKRMDGVGIFACRALFDLSKVEKSNGYAFTNPETMPVISNLFTTVGRELGPLFRAIPEREPTVAYLESYASTFFAHHASWGWDGPIYDCGVMATAAQLNPYVLYEEEIATRGIPPTVKVVIARLCEVLAEPTYEALLSFQRRGGVIVADEKLPPGILPDYDFPAFGRPNLRGTAEDKKGLVRAAMELKDIAKRHVKLPADTENPDIVLMTRTSGDADYVFAINDRREYGDYVGKAWKRVMEKGLPNSGTVVLNRKAGAVYDLVAHRALPIRAKDGMTEVDVAYENTDGKVLMAVTRPLGRLKIRREGASVVVTSPDRDVLIPIEVTADGREPRFGVVTDGVWRRDYPEGGNLRVRNLCDGMISEADREIDDLIAGMSVREKLGQLKQGVLYTREDVDRYLPIVRKGEVGSFIFNETLKREWRDELQKAALESPRRIPLSFADNIIHGWRTNFPIPLALACSFEPELFEEMAHVGAREGREAGLDWTFGPMCDTARDPRWGRVAEGCGEDPWLNGVYAAAQVRGFQGEDASAPDRVAACIKHYCGYSSSMGGHDYNDADFSEWSLWNLHLPPFAAAIDAGALTVMSGFNTVDGVPVLASRRIMTDILRDGLGFRGMVVTDYNAVIQTVTWGLAADEGEAASLCLRAGNDVEMKSSAYDTLEGALAEGRLAQSVIDESVRRVLRFKHAVGLFRRPWAIPEPDAELRRREDAEALALARKCAVRSAVLVKNDGVLPLAGDSDVRVALIGPLAEDRKTFVGCWAGMESHGPEVPESLADAVRRAMGGKGRLRVVRGCSTNVKPPVAKRDDGLPVLDRESVPDDASFDLEGAIAAAREADVVIFALGEALDWTGENASRCQLTPTGRQVELFEKVTSAIGDKRIVTLLISGRPLAVPVVNRRSDAVFVAFHGGDGGASALADLIFGKASPSGRLTISVPYDVSQVPVFYNAFATGRPNQGHYLDTPERGAMYPFGFGLTYTRFAYSPVSIRGRSAVARITNTGTRPGEEVVQLYIHQRSCAEGVRPKRELRGFRKVSLDPGDSTSVEFPLDAKTLGYYDRTGRWRCDSGTYDVFIAPDSASGAGMRFEWE